MSERWSRDLYTPNVTELIAVCALVVVIGIPFTLWWWKQADKWADAEHKRFAVKPDTRERIVVSRRPAERDGAGDAVGRERSEHD